MASGSGGGPLHPGWPWVLRPQPDDAALTTPTPARRPGRSRRDRGGPVARPGGDVLAGGPGVAGWGVTVGRILGGHGPRRRSRCRPDGHGGDHDHRRPGARPGEPRGHPHRPAARRRRPSARPRRGRAGAGPAAADLRLDARPSGPLPARRLRPRLRPQPAAVRAVLLGAGLLGLRRGRAVVPPGGPDPWVRPGSLRSGERGRRRRRGDHDDGVGSRHGPDRARGNRRRRALRRGRRGPRGRLRAGDGGPSGPGGSSPSPRTRSRPPWRRPRRRCCWSRGPPTPSSPTRPASPCSPSCPDRPTTCPCSVRTTCRRSPGARPWTPVLDGAVADFLDATVAHRGPGGAATHRTARGVAARPPGDQGLISAVRVNPGPGRCRIGLRSITMTGARPRVPCPGRPPPTKGAPWPPLPCRTNCRSSRHRWRVGRRRRH